MPINIGTSSDPYPPEEIVYRLTRRALEILVPLGRRVLITTKGTLYARRDLGLIRKGNVAVTPTITTLSSHIALLIEPGAPHPRARLEALRAAARSGVPVGVRIDPIIPYVNDDPFELESLVEEVAGAGARFIVTSTYKAKPDNFRRLLSSLGSGAARRLKELYASGERIQGYRYLPKALREKLLAPVVRAARRQGLEYATCREGLTGREWFNAASCDGTHLIPLRVKPRGLNGSIGEYLVDPG